MGSQTGKDSLSACVFTQLFRHALRDEVAENCHLKSRVNVRLESFETLLLAPYKPCQLAEKVLRLPGSRSGCPSRAPPPLHIPAGQRQVGPLEFMHGGLHSWSAFLPQAVDRHLDHKSHGLQGVPCFVRQICHRKRRYSCRVHLVICRSRCS